MKTHSSSGLSGHSAKIDSGAVSTELDVGLKNDMAMAADPGGDDGGSGDKIPVAIGDVDVS